MNKQVKKFAESLEVSPTGKLLSPPAQVPSALLNTWSCIVETRAFDGFPVQFVFQKSLKQDRQTQRSCFKAGQIDEDLWQLYTGSHSYYYDMNGRLVFDPDTDEWT